MNSQQLGRFEIKEELVRENPEIVAQAFADMQFVPVKAELMFCSQRIEYTGISPRFEEIERGTIIPEYRVDIFMSYTEGCDPVYTETEVKRIRPHILEKSEAARGCTHSKWKDDIQSALRECLICGETFNLLEQIKRG